MSMQGSTARSGWPVLLPFLLLAGTGAALAHHGAAPHFDMRNPIELPGTVMRFEARNPHSFLPFSRCNCEPDRD